MRTRIILFVIFFLMILSKAFSQTNQNSDHPLLDKYYPQPTKANVDTNRKVTSTLVTPKQQALKPLSNLVNNPAPKITPVINTDTTSEPLTTTTHGITTNDTKSTPVLTSTSVISKPTVVSPPAVPVKTVPSGYSPNSLYSETRLGSSTPQYDTYEKNSNGEGSVTTSPK